MSSPKRWKPVRGGTHPRRAARARWLALVALAALALASPRPGEAADGLSQAAKETKKKPADQATLAAKPRDDGGGGGFLSLFVGGGDRNCLEEDASSRPRRRNPLDGLHVGLVAGRGTGGGVLEPAVFGGLKVGARLGPRWRADLDLFGGSQRFTSRSGLVGAFDQPLALGLDLSVRHTVIRAGSPLAIAPMVGFRYDDLSWDYRNGVWLDDGWGEYLAGDDELGAYSPYVGLAVGLVESRHFQLAGTVKTGVQFFDRHSDQGLRNDVFQTRPFVRVGLETTFPF